MNTESVDGKEPIDELSSFFRLAKRRGHTVTAVVECEVEYEGRAAATLAAGERVLILKPDGVVAVHKDENRKPVNWQPPGSSYSVRTEDELLIIESHRKNPDEFLGIRVTDVHHGMSRKLRDNVDLDLVGTEEDVVDKICENPDLIEPGFRVVEREWETGAGPVDIYGRSETGEPCCVEVKRGTVSPANVMQLHRYIESVTTETEESTHRGIIVGADISQKAETVIEEEGFRFVAVEPDLIHSQTRTQTLNDY